MAFHAIYGTVDAVLKFLREHLLEGDVTPSATNSKSIGTALLQLKNMYVDGIAFIDAFNCDNVITKSGAYTAKTTDHIILANTSGGAVTITLPAVADAAGLILIFIRTGAGANALTIDGDGAETINGAANNADMDAQYDMLTLYCDGTEWFIIGRYIQ
jgi:hypothetical protein